VAAAHFGWRGRHRCGKRRSDVSRRWGKDWRWGVGDSDLCPDGPGAGFVLCVFCPSSSSSSRVILGLIRNNEVV
jgi:hypothetical protein